MDQDQEEDEDDDLIFEERSGGGGRGTNGGTTSAGSSSVEEESEQRRRRRKLDNDGRGDGKNHLGASGIEATGDMSEEDMMARAIEESLRVSRVGGETSASESGGAGSGSPSNPVSLLRLAVHLSVLSS